MAAPCTALHRIAASHRLFTHNTLRRVNCVNRRIPAASRDAWIYVKEVCRHYWVNTKLLAADFRTAWALVLKVLKGQGLTRYVTRQRKRHANDTGNVCVALTLACARVVCVYV